jgi:hypothetical protein
VDVSILLACSISNSIFIFWHQLSCDVAVGFIEHWIVSLTNNYVVYKYSQLFHSLLYHTCSVPCWNYGLSLVPAVVVGSLVGSGVLLYIGLLHSSGCPCGIFKILHCVTIYTVGTSMIRQWTQFSVDRTPDILRTWKNCFYFMSFKQPLYRLLWCMVTIPASY